ncbi:hypothetical protein C8R43DRAFT_1129522 [Mycena crocata]|nr:hypothetical protein C8R43DRAFT_1129522 [Mycena crocata]
MSFILQPSLFDIMCEVLRPRSRPWRSSLRFRITRSTNAEIMFQNSETMAIYLYVSCLRFKLASSTNSFTFQFTRSSPQVLNMESIGWKKPPEANLQVQLQGAVSNRSLSCFTLRGAAAQRRPPLIYLAATLKTRWFGNTCSQSGPALEANASLDLQYSAGPLSRCMSRKAAAQRRHTEDKMHRVSRADSTFHYGKDPRLRFGVVVPAIRALISKSRI